MNLGSSAISTTAHSDADMAYRLSLALVLLLGLLAGCTATPAPESPPSFLGPAPTFQPVVSAPKPNEQEWKRAQIRALDARMQGLEKQRQAQNRWHKEKERQARLRSERELQDFQRQAEARWPQAPYVPQPAPASELPQAAISPEIPAAPTGGDSDSVVIQQYGPLPGSPPADYPEPPVYVLEPTVAPTYNTSGPVYHAKSGPYTYGSHRAGPPARRGYGRNSGYSDGGYPGYTGYSGYDAFGQSFGEDQLVRKPGGGYYHRTKADGNPYNNYSMKGRVNPWTGKRGTVDPSRPRRR